MAPLSRIRQGVGRRHDVVYRSREDGCFFVLLDFHRNLFRHFNLSRSLGRWGRRWWRRGLRDGCGWRSGRWGGSAAGGGRLTGLLLVPGLVQLRDLRLRLLGVVFYDIPCSKTLVAIDVGVPDEAMRTHLVGRGKTSPDLFIGGTTSGWRRVVGGGRSGGRAGGGGGGGVGGDCGGN